MVFVRQEVVQFFLMRASTPPEGISRPSYAPDDNLALQYNLCNEPWLKYTLSAIADRGLKSSQWTSSRLMDEVLLLETAG